MYYSVTRLLYGGTPPPTLRMCPSFPSRARPPDVIPLLPHDYSVPNLESLPNSYFHYFHPPNTKHTLLFSPSIQFIPLTPPYPTPPLVPSNLELASLILRLCITTLLHPITATASIPRHGSLPAHAQSELSSYPSTIRSSHPTTACATYGGSIYTRAPRSISRSSFFRQERCAIQSCRLPIKWRM